MPRQITSRLTVAEVHFGHVVCTGVFATADQKGTHSLLRPTLLHDEIQRDPTIPIAVGDTIVCYADGTREHQPKS